MPMESVCPLSGVSMLCELARPGKWVDARTGLNTPSHKMGDNHVGKVLHFGMLIRV